MPFSSYVSLSSLDINSVVIISFHFSYHVMRSLFFRIHSDALRDRDINEQESDIVLSVYV